MQDQRCAMLTPVGKECIVGRWGKSLDPLPIRNKQWDALAATGLCPLTETAPGGRVQNDAFGYRVGGRSGHRRPQLLEIGRRGVRQRAAWQVLEVDCLLK